MSDVVVFGATGFTGRLVVQALLDVGMKNVTIGGRNEPKLAELARQMGGLEYRVADAGDAASLARLVAGARVVISTAGPFIRYGEPVVRAALEASAHFLDTTGEQVYMSRVLELYHGAARARRRVVVNAQAFEFALGYCAAALLAESEPETPTVDVFNRVAGLGSSRGTQKSAVLAGLGPALIRRDGRLVERGLSPRPMWVLVPGEALEPATPFPGGEALHLSRTYPQLRNITTNMVVPKRVALAMMAAWSSRPLLKLASRAGLVDKLFARIDQGPEGPDEASRASQSFKVFARGTRRGVMLTGADPYGITAIVAALGAQWLCRKEPLNTGVVSTDQAFGAREFVEALAPHGVQLSHHEL